jgi:hypothetical protein
MNCLNGGPFSKINGTWRQGELKQLAPMLHEVEPMAGIAPRPAVFDQTAAPSCLLRFKKLQQLTLNSLILKGFLNPSTIISMCVHFFSGQARAKK